MGDVGDGGAGRAVHGHDDGPGDKGKADDGQGHHDDVLPHEAAGTELGPVVREAPLVVVRHADGRRLIKAGTESGEKRRL